MAACGEKMVMPLMNLHPEDACDHWQTVTIREQVSDQRVTLISRGACLEDRFLLYDHSSHYRSAECESFSSRMLRQRSLPWSIRLFAAIPRSSLGMAGRKRLYCRSKNSKGFRGS